MNTRDPMNDPTVTISDRAAVSRRQSQVISQKSSRPMSSTPKQSILKTESRRIELDRNLGTDPYQILERLMRSSLTEDVEEFGKVSADVALFQSQMHSEYDSVGSIADADL